MTTRTSLGALADRLARLDIDAIASAALSVQAGAIAAAVREVLSHPPGSEHEYPWLRSGALRDSIVTDAGANEAVIASTSDVAIYQEHGTSTVPPRPFLAPVAAAHAAEVASGIGAAVASAVSGEHLAATPP